MKRSSPQNRYYHGVLVKEATGHYKENIGDMIRDVLKAIDAEPSEMFVHELFKMMFNKGGSTTKLDTAEMELYNLAIRSHFGVEHGVDIPPPNMEAYNDGV